MKKNFFLAFTYISLLSIVACAIKPQITNQYKLSSYSSKQLSKSNSPKSIFVSMPDAMPGYQSNEMLYSDKMFEVKPFVHNAWIASPAHMLLPLIVQSLQRSNYFRVVAASPDFVKTDYRLNTQLIELHQNFLTKPSKINLLAKCTLSQTATNRVIFSKIIKQEISCAEESPYGGVIAANIATVKFTAKLTALIINNTRSG